jgi:plastocyanin
MKKALAILLIILPLGVYSQVVHDYIFSGLNATVTLYDSSTTNFMGFGRYNTGTATNITFPGPLLRYNAGDSLAIHFRNDDTDKHTIHLHGLDVNQVNDGVPFTSFSIASGDSFIYNFVPNYPGVYLYHCHVATVFHLPMGMYGMIVIDYPGNLLYSGGPGYNKEYDFLSSDMYRFWNDNPTSPGLFYEYNPDYFFINGLSNQQLFADTSQIINASPGDSILLRLANIGYTMVEYVFPFGSNATVHMSDGRVLPNVISLDTLKIYPGERYSVLLKPTTAISSFITVNVYDMFLNNLLGTNLIGINKFNFPTHVEEISSNSDWKIYPNPFTDELHIDRPYKKYENVTLSDMSNREILRFQLKGKSTIISLNFLKKGRYILKCESGNSWQIIKQ